MCARYERRSSALRLSTARRLGTRTQWHGLQIDLVIFLPALSDGVVRHSTVSGVATVGTPREVRQLRSPPGWVRYWQIDSRCLIALGDRFLTRQLIVLARAYDSNRCPAKLPVSQVNILGHEPIVNRQPRYAAGSKSWATRGP